MVTVTIRGEDVTRLVEYSSLKILNILTSEPDECELVIRKFGSRTFVPMVHDEIIITDSNGDRIFAGHLQDVTEDYDKLDYIEYHCIATDYTRFMDARLVVNTYEGQTVNQIIQDIKDTYLDNSITITNVNGPDIIEYIAFNYEYPSDCFKQLAELTNSDWYIDYNKDVHFFKKETLSAPFDLTDTNGKYIYDSLVIRKDIKQLRNVVYVRGGEFLADVTTAAYEADGIRRNFFLPHKFSNLTLTVTGQEKNVGVDPIDLETNFDALHNFNEKVVKFREDKKPSSGSEVRIGGNPHLPILVKMRDTASISTFTTREYAVIDKSIQTKEGARQRALAELFAYKSTIQEGQFMTYETGLRAGQTINVQSTLRDVNKDYVINRVEARIFGTNAADKEVQFVYKVSLMTTRTFDHIQLLQKLLNTKRKEIVVDENEILDEVESIIENMGLSEVVTASLVHESIAETMALSEVFTAHDDNFHTQFVAGPFIPDDEFEDTTGLVAWWKADEGSGAGSDPTIIDHSGQGNDMSLLNITWVTPGIFAGSAPELDPAANSRGDVPDTSDINTMNVTQRTYTFFFKPNRATDRHVIYKEGGGAAIVIYIEGGQLYAAYSDTVLLGSVNGGNIEAGKVYFGAFVFNSTGSSQKLFVWDVQVDSDTNSSSIPSHPGDINIGYSDANVQYHDGADAGNNRFAGILQHMKIYNHILTDDEIKDLARESKRVAIANGSRVGQVV